MTEVKPNPYETIIDKMAELSAEKLKAMFFAMEDEDYTTALLLEGEFTAIVEVTGNIYGVNLMKFSREKGGIFRRAIHGFIHGDKSDKKSETKISKVGA